MAALSIADSLFKYVEGLQAKADSSYEQYPEHQTILPNDAIYLARVMNLKALLGVIEYLVEKSGKSLVDVLTLSIVPNREALLNQYKFTEQALDAIIKQYGGNE